MRRWLPLLLAGLALAQDDPWDKVTMKEVQDPEGRVFATVPESWRTQEIAGNIILRVLATHAGGHDLMIVREDGQSDVDAQRDRYIQYDSGKYAGAEVKKYNSPFYGYRLNAPGQNRVLLRAFLADGADGLVVSLASRLKMYDKVWQRKMFAVMGSIRVVGGAKGGTPELAGEARRIFDEKARVSLVAPGAWRRLPSEGDDEVLFLGLKGTRAGPSLRILATGSNTNINLVLSSLSRRWKQAYGNIVLRKIAGKPPRLLAKHRKPGWVDYVTPYAPGGDGYALILAVREGSYERYRNVADEVARTVVFTAGDYASPTESPGDIRQEVKGFVIFMAAEQTTAGDRIAKLLKGFTRAWGRIAIAESKKAPPLHISIVDEGEFEQAASWFGDKPVAYNPGSRFVVVTPPPSDKEALPRWRNALYGALTEAALHRNLDGRAPPWLRAGLVACMRAAGHANGKPDEPNPAFVGILDVKISTDAHPGLRDILKLSHADYVLAQTVDHAAVTWGYVHLMLFGGGTVASSYKKFVKVLAKAKGQVPHLDLKKYDRDREDLKRHAEKQKWLK